MESRVIDAFLTSSEQTAVQIPTAQKWSQRSGVIRPFNKDVI